jgi:hypothetical protein
VDAGLRGGDGGAGELHGITAKLLEVTAWLEKGRGDLTAAWWFAADGERGGGRVEKKLRKQTTDMRVDISSRSDVVVGQSLGRGGVAWRARKEARGGELG